MTKEHDEEPNTHWSGPFNKEAVEGPTKHSAFHHTLTKDSELAHQQTNNNVIRQKRS